MKWLLFMIGTCVAVSSCSSYQYLTLSSDRLTKNEEKELVWENDSLKISFNFNGEWGKFNITMMNKTDQAISIDWLKSAVVYNGKAYSLFDESISLEGDIWRNRQYVRRPLLEKEEPLATVKAEVALPREMDFMPPKSAVGRNGINIAKMILQTPGLPQDLPVEKLRHEDVNIKFRKASYDAASAPLKFNIYLTFMAADGKTFYFNQPFYVSEIKQTDESGLHQVLIETNGDKFYRKLVQ